jgi:hypothetical protein
MEIGNSREGLRSGGLYVASTPKAYGVIPLYLKSYLKHGKKGGNARSKICPSPHIIQSSSGTPSARF